MSLGFEQAGFNVAAAVDADRIHAATYQENFPHTKTIQKDITQLTGESLRTLAGLGAQRVSVVFGGPPCQGFSLIGKRLHDDPRNELLLEFARIVREIEPDYFVAENVKGLLLGNASQMLQSFVSEVELAGYSVVKPIKVLNAKDFGVPQRRERVFILGYRRGVEPPTYPDTDSFRTELLGGCPTVADAIEDLIPLEKVKELVHNDAYCGELGPCSPYSGVLRGQIHDPSDLSHKQDISSLGLTGCLRSVHSAETVRRFKGTVPGTYEPVSRFYRLTSGGVAPTLRAGTDATNGSFMAPRPIHYHFPRCITVREAARLHSFPDWFKLHPTRWHGFRQVGNSVPPLLARAVARSIARIAL